MRVAAPPPGKLLSVPHAPYRFHLTAQVRPRAAIAGLALRPRPLALCAMALLAVPAVAQPSAPAAPITQATPIAGAEPLILRATPMLAENVPDQASAAFISGDRLEGRSELETVLQGGAELRKPGLVVRAERLEYDQSRDLLKAQGGVQINARGNRYAGSEGELLVDAFEGFVLQPSYEFLATGGHGEGSRIDFLDPDRAIIRNATYTTCRRDGPGWMPDWLLRARRMHVDEEEEVGWAEGAALDFKGVPILPIPSVTFPLSSQRKSGWLPPTIALDNVSGLDLTVPYYWNIAPNRDATLLPSLMTRRGVDLFGEFRYLESDYQGRVQGNLMPYDKLRARNRWGLFARHSGTVHSGIDAVGPLSLNLNLNRVSDNDYWRDFTRRGLSLTTRLLANDATLGWSRGDFSLTARALKWQTLQDVTAPIVPPYDRLPQLAGRWARVDDRGFDYSVDGDYTRFRGDAAFTQQANADRTVLHAQLARPWVRPWGFFKPKVQLHATNYQFDRALANGATSANRVLPTFSLDGGLVYERSTSYFGRAFTQTLEPRVFYVYTPYRDQSLLPNYDSAQYDFNFATVFTENAFVGNDRIADNKLLTLGVTTRLLDPDSGAEAVRLGIAQRVRFADQKVVMPGAPVVTDRLSDILLGATINWDPRWSFDGLAQYNPKTRESLRTTLSMRYSPGDYRTVALAYRRQRDLNTQQIDLGWQWPLNDLWGDRGQDLGRGQGQGDGRWYSVGRLNYSVPDRRVVDAVVGLEYDAGCWIGRVVFERLQSAVTSSTKRIMFQLEFVGFSRIGSNPLRTLRNNIPRYQFLREETASPSRFTHYD